MKFASPQVAEGLRQNKQIEAEGRNMKKQCGAERQTLHSSPLQSKTATMIHGQDADVLLM